MCSNLSIFVVQLTINGCSSNKYHKTTGVIEQDCTFWCKLIHDIYTCMLKEPTVGLGIVKRRGFLNRYAAHVTGATLKTTSFVKEKSRH